MALCQTHEGNGSGCLRCYETCTPQTRRDQFASRHWPLLDPWLMVQLSACNLKNTDESHRRHSVDDTVTIPLGLFPPHFAHNSGHILLHRSCTSTRRSKIKTRLPMEFSQLKAQRYQQVWTLLSTSTTLCIYFLTHWAFDDVHLHVPVIVDLQIT